MSAPSSAPLIVIVGATGRQGGATVRVLLRETGRWRVRAVTRNPSSAEALALAKAHPEVEVVRADATDKASLVAAFRGAAGVFGVTNPFSQRWAPGKGADMDLHGEERQGQNLVDACKEAGVGHFVFSSVAAAHEKTGVPTFEVKARVEDYLRASGVPYTILAPVGFYENLESPFAGIVRTRGCGRGRVL